MTLPYFASKLSAQPRSLRLNALAAATMLAACLPAQAATLRVSMQGDALSMDPHSLAEAVQLAFTGNIYEPLVAYDQNLKLVPALATKWQITKPTVWRFELRKGVQFHDGQPMTADDVVFSLDRARGQGSDMAGNLNSIAAVRKVDATTVEVETKAANPILPNLLATVYIMSRAWSEANGAVKPVDRRKGIENTASFKANGTGPYRLRERQPAVRTVLGRNGSYWGKVEGNVTDVVFQPIANDATRVAALLSHEVDLIDPVPLQDVPQLKTNKQIKVMQGAEPRVIFLGFDQKRDELLYSNVKGKNPFKDKRVRQAVYQAIDTATIIDKVMRNAAKPTGLMVADGMEGYAAALDKRLPYDPAASRKLLTEAGYPDGFEVALNCPNDRYVNDAAVCQAVAANLARVAIKVKLQTEPKAQYFPRVLKRDTSFFMLGWIPAGYDTHNALSLLMATPNGAQGSWNMGAYSNAKLDALTQAIGSETDLPKRTRLMQEALALHRDDIGHVPLHQQALAWGMDAKVEAVQRADNYMFYRWITVK